MLKIFTTQLSGIFSRIGDKQAEAIEDGARLLAQAVVSGHAVYFHGKNELAAVVLEASESKEPFPGAKVLPLDQKERSLLHPSDRVLLFYSDPEDQEIQSLVKELHEQGTPIVGVGPAQKETSFIEEHCDVHIDFQLKKPLVPAEDGTRFGYPALMTCLYVYHALSFTVKEIVEEYE
ncbi:DUF2529 domain-containing protein [Bacillus altitudinis]|uniref:DUF2529 domain-containing protein n=1 Tax=Bacillus altitudinis TaxID=293387 RepID=UPI002E1E770D|nr:DUF2529 domain-containing protein [Bacillus altitudinis]